MTAMLVRSSIVAVSLMLAACATPGRTEAQNLTVASTAYPRTISVAGDAEVLVEPDFVEITMGTEGRDADAKKAREACHEKMTAVLDAARAAGIAEKDLATDNFQLEPIYRWEDNRQVFEIYSCRKTLVITLRNPAKLDQLVEALIGAGSDSLQGIEFRTTDLRKHRDEARRLALVAAKEKAAAMAGTLDQKIGRPQSISENFSTWEPWSYGGRNMRGMAQNISQDSGGSGTSESASSTALGRIRVRATVSVVFELKD